VYIADISLSNKEIHTDKKGMQNIEFKPYNDILNIMKISSCGTSCAAVKMLKRLDPMLYQASSASGDQVKSLEDS